MAIRENLVNLAMKMDGTGRPIPEEDSLYIALDCLMSDEQIELINFMERRIPITAEELSEKSGKNLEETERLLEEVRMIGLVQDMYSRGRKEWVLLVVIPGIAENLVLNKKQFAEHKIEISKMFHDVSMMPPFLVPMIPIGGAGLAMHVIPIEEAIPAGTKTVSHEQISHWLKKYDFISVQDCQCRTVMAALDEWCGHTIKDRCFYVGDAGRYIVSTGRGRRVNYDEAMQIMKEAEEEGLMHQCSNIDGPDEIFTICNCCRCGCQSLKNSFFYNMPNANRSNFIAKVDPEKCAACGECVEYCPANAVKLGQSLCMKTPAPELEEKILKPEEWGPEHWNPEWRSKRDYVAETGTAPCKVECPAHISVQAYIRLAAQGKFTDALELIKKENPFPAICGRICPHECESECTRGCIDEGVAVDEIKKYIADQELKSAVRFIPKKRHNYNDKKIAIVGAGPAGLSCAYYLALDGYTITVFEKHDKLGGMLTLGIPAFRLEKDVINAEIEVLRELGVKFKTGVEVGKDITLDELRAQGYVGFYLAIGAQSGRKLGLDEEDAEGVISGIDFLRNVNLGKEAKLSGNVIVIGGGNVAIDVARTAVRANAEAVTLYCLESPEEMPALPEEIEEATSENIRINNSWGPKHIVVENGKVTGVEFKKCVSVFDNGNFSPKYDESETITVPADYVLLSVGQSIEWGKLLEGSKVKLGHGSTAVANTFTYQTDEPDVFVGGDVFTGTKFAIDAIAGGKQAAAYLSHYVQPGQNLTIGLSQREFTALDKENVVIGGYDDTPRQKIGHTKGMVKTFRDNRETFTEEQLKKETDRCLKCGVSIVNENKCIGCALCTTKCKFDAISIEKRFDGQFISLEEAMANIEPYVLKVKGNEVYREPANK
ncbi:MAG TPA: FAD-dependent oxidoreductase [Desulfosporosinus sp.]|nr:FAD-dependent oxidoreductase [Desulfosporosinus sp.]